MAKYRGDLCEGDPGTWESAGKYTDRSYQWYFGVSIPRPEGIPRKAVRCPKCGRRIVPSVELNGDGDLIKYSIPPHKPKGWWKRAKRKSKDNHKDKRKIRY